MIFDGRAFAKKIEEQVSYKVRNLVKRPKIVSVLLGSDPASVLYTKLKKQAAKRVGIEFEVEKMVNDQWSMVELQQKIRETGARVDVTGVMVQLPIRGLQGQALQEVLRAIPLSKDVDGLRWEESGVKPATVRAILEILNEIANRKSSDHFLNASLPAGRQGSELWGQKFVVVGARGAVGRPLTHFLKERGLELSEVEWDTPDPARTVLAGEVVISCVGKAGIVTGEMVSEGAVVIDVGMSMVGGKAVGDMTQEVYQKASVAVAVPGGVGPVTIVSLLANAEEIYDGKSYTRFKLGRVGGSSSF